MRTPLARALLLSAALHLAVLGLIQVAPVSYEAAVTVLQVNLPEPGPAGAAAITTPAAKEPAETLAEPSPPAPQPTLAETPAPQAVPQVAAVSEPARPAKSEPVGALSLPSPVDPRWYGAREVDTHPRALSRIEPIYPEAARRRGQTGWVKLRLMIDEYGQVKEAEVIEASPPGVFDAAALQAFEPARFEPARRQGRPVRYEGYFRVMFELD
ncbi:protein TonB [Sulfuritortus calidifontis]|uniref:Protein TonB n=1 Tax=Sulfuritortus calidifontis TaxID=1914471 RepID=A0A4R3JWE1_9PROT|nr:energy transducer TonB [Sulfuritortus calidifontis]TCS72628.1 protein TonB [Sulfuritortus calidifontis]